MPTKSFPRTGYRLQHSQSPRRTMLGVESLEVRVAPAVFIAAGTDAGPVAKVRILTDADANGTFETVTTTFRPFGAVKTGVRVAMGDFDGDGNAELVCGSGAGGGKVNIYSLNSDGTIGAQLETFAPWGNGFKGGVFVAAGDLNNDGKDELAVARGSLGSSIAIYSDTDFDKFVGDNRTDTFNPWGGFKGGARLAFGDTNNTGGEELIAGRGPGGPATVNVYTDSDANRSVSDEARLESFVAFAGGYKGGITVAAGAAFGVNNGGAEVYVARDTGVSTVKVFSDANANGKVGDDPLFDAVNVFNNFKGGVRLATGDVDDGIPGQSTVHQELIVGPGPGGNTLAIRRATNGRFSTTPASDTLFPFGLGAKHGFFVAAGQVLQASFESPVVPVNLPDASTTTVSTFVPATAGKIRELSIKLRIAHTFNDDLDVTLTHVPTGTTLELFSDVGDSGDGFDITLTSDAFFRMGDVAGIDGQVLSGEFDVEAGSLSIFNGLDASGEWKLTIVDDAGQDFGTLNEFTINFTF